MILTKEKLLEFIKLHGSRPGDEDLLIKFGVKTKSLPKPILPVHVLADSSCEAETHAEDVTRESTLDTTGENKRLSDSRGGQKPFDKKTYHKEYMKKRPAKNKAKS